MRHSCLFCFVRYRNNTKISFVSRISPKERWKYSILLRVSYSLHTVTCFFFQHAAVQINADTLKIEILLFRITLRGTFQKRVIFFSTCINKLVVSVSRIGRWWISFNLLLRYGNVASFGLWVWISLFRVIRRTPLQFRYFLKLRSR